MWRKGEVGIHRKNTLPTAIITTTSPQNNIMAYGVEREQYVLPMGCELFLYKLSNVNFSYVPL